MTFLQERGFLLATPVTEPNYYDLIMTFQNNAVPTEKWRATCTFFSSATPDLGTNLPLAVASAFVAFTRSTSSLVERSIYNWSRGRQPYPTGSPIESLTTVFLGTADTNWPHLNSTYLATGGEVVLRMDHEPVAAGKPGRNFLRGLLGIHDVTATTGGKWVLVPALSDLQSDLDSILVASHVTDYFTVGTAGQHIAQVRYSALHNTVNGTSEVFSWRLFGVTTSKLNRKNRR